MRKIFEYIGLISLMCFSFFITEKTTIIVKNNDDVMLEIKNNYSNYEIEPIDANISGNKIIPGICGKKVDIETSYKKMTELGLYNDKLYQYTKEYPSIHLKNNYDKLVIADNSKNNNIYFFIKLDTEKLVKNYHFENYNFIVSSEFYQKNTSLIYKLKKNNNSILIKPTLFKKYKKVSRDYWNKFNKSIFCYNENNMDFLQICSAGKSNSLLVTNKIDNNYFFNIKNNLKNGQFIELALNQNFIDEKEQIEAYIKSKGYFIKSIDTTLYECS